MTQVGVIIPVLNQFKLALETIDSINLPSYSHKVYIERNYVQNRGVSFAWNNGISRAISDGAEIFIILNDDIVLGRYALEHMVSLLYAQNDVEFVTGTDVRDFKTPDSLLLSELPSHEPDLIDAPNFACFGLTKYAYDLVGKFDEIFYPAYFEDNDYTYRCILNGITPYRSQNIEFYHYGSQTQNANPNAPICPSPQFEKNRGHYVEKWGGVPGQEKYTVPYGGKL